MKTRTLLVIITALLFNVIVGGAVSAATGLNPWAVIGAGSLLSSGMSLTGVAPMAIQKEIWLSSLVENLFANNSFLSKAFNADEFVNQGKTVHIPNSGAPSATVKNRTSFPATVYTRTDVDLTFELDEFTTDPIKIPHADTVELSYNKRESVLKNDKASLMEVIANDFVYKWSPSSSYIVRTTGENVAAHTPSATSNRKAMVMADVLTLMNRFNEGNVPQEGRYLLLDAVMYGQLLKDMSTQESADFNKQADVANGVLGKVYTFNIMMRSKAARYAANLTPKAWTASGTTTDFAAGLAWHEGSVCRALGEAVMFDSENNPLYYGDIYSFLVRAGGRPMRNDVAGLLAIVQDDPAQ